MALTNAPDLTKRSPRSPRVRLGGYAILARMLDKGRATIAGTNGEYNFGCPTDEQFLDFVGIDLAKLRKQLATGKGDGDILAWIEATASKKRGPSEIAAWSAYQDRRIPTTIEGRDYFHSVHNTLAPKREDIGTWFELLDMDDYSSFGGKV